MSGSQAGWTGSAAEGSRAALAKVGEFSGMTGDHFTATGEVLQAQTSAASEAKARMPDPVEYDPKKMFTDALKSGSLLQLAALPATMPMQRAKSENAKAEAVQVMQSRDDAMRSATGTMPAFAEMPTVTHDQGTATSTSRTSSVTTSTVNPDSGVGTTGTPGTGNNGTTDTSGTTSTSWTAPTAVATPPSAPPVNLPPSGPPAPPTTPPWALPPGAKPPTGRPPQSGRHLPPPPGTRPPGIGTPPGRGGTGGGPGGAGGGRPGMPGGPGGMPSGMPGRGAAPGFGPTGTPGQAGGAGQGGRGAAGTPGVMGGAGAGGGQGQGGEDQEHKAKYLIPTDEYFDDNRLVSPPTIGE